MKLTINKNGLEGMLDNILFLYKHDFVFFDKHGYPVSKNSDAHINIFKYLFIYLFYKFPDFEKELLSIGGLSSLYESDFDNIHDIRKSPKSLRALPITMNWIEADFLKYDSFNKKICTILKASKKVSNYSNNIIIENDEFSVQLSIDDIDEFFYCESKSKEIILYLLSFKSLNSEYLNITTLTSINSLLFKDFSNWLNEVSLFRVKSRQESLKKINNKNQSYYTNKTLSKGRFGCSIIE